MSVSGYFKSGQLVGLIHEGSPTEEYRLFFDRVDQGEKDNKKKLQLTIVNPLTNLHLASIKGKFYWTKKVVLLHVRGQELIPNKEIQVQFDEDETQHQFKLVPSVTKTTGNLEATLSALRNGEELHTGYNLEQPKAEPQDGVFKMNDMVTVIAIFLILIGLAVVAYMICRLFLKV